MVFSGSNKAADRILNIDNSQFVGKTIEEAFPALKDSDIPDRYREVARIGGRFESELLQYQDERISGLFEVVASRTGPGRIAAFFRDITEKKQADEAIRAVEQKLREIVEHSTNLFYMHTADHVLTYVSPQSRAFFGCEPEEALVRWTDFITDHPMNRNAIAATQRAIDTGEPQPPYECQCRGKEGRIVWVEVREAPIVKNGKTTAIVGALTDITERKRAEEELRTSQQQLQLLIDRMPIGCIVWSPDFSVQLWNPMATRIFGFSAQEMLGKRPYGMIVPEAVQHHVQDIWQRLLTGDQMAHSVNENVTKDGRTIVCDWYNTPVRDEEGKVTVVISMVQDVTDRVRMEEERGRLEGQLMQAQKMESIGLLAGGVAHDFNNILTAIIGYGNLLYQKLPAGTPARSNVEHILSAADRASRLTQGLLTFGQKQLISPRPIDVNAALRRTESLLGRMIGEDVDLIMELSAVPVTVVIDEGQLDQVIMNLAANAREAMPQGGVITIRTGGKKLDRNFAVANGLASTGKYAVISIADTGMGMDETTRQRIFEPFFTTKGLGRGTGLGLAIVYGIVSQNNGAITCDSEPGKGTSFTIYLPFSRERAVADRIAKTGNAPAGGETILVAEDDGILRNLAKTVLEEHGYTVILAEDGEDAVRKFRARQDEISMVLLDVIMPRKDGKQAYDEILKVRPGLPALFMSGYAGAMVSKTGVLQDGIEFISKPTAPHELLKRIRAILDHHQAKNG